MQIVEIKYMLYTHYVKGKYFDFRGCVLSNNAEYTLKDMPALFNTYAIVNVEVVNGVIKHKKGTNRFYNMTYDKYMQRKKQAIKDIKSVSSKELSVEGRSELTKNSRKLAVLKYNKNVTKQNTTHEYVKGFIPRFCFSSVLEAFLKVDDQIVALCGVRRTGKTVLMQQIEEKVVQMGYTTAFLTCTSGMKMQDIYTFLNSVIERGINYVFIDEITFVSDFLYKCDALGNKYACSLHIMIAGTNSFQLRVASSQLLYGRIHWFPFTYVSFYEYHTLLGRGLREYIQSGGLLYNTFKDYPATHEFIDSAIIENFRSVFYYTYYSEKHKDLYAMYTSGSLQWYINKILENNAVSILSNSFKNARLGSAMQMLDSRIDTIDDETWHRIYDTYTYRLEGKHIELDANLERLVVSFLRDIGVLYKDVTQQFITVPGLVYSLMLELLSVLTEEVRSENSGMTASVCSKLMQKIIEDTEGVLIENVVFYDTLKALTTEVIYEKQQYVVDKYSTAQLEFDMTITNMNTLEADIFEIKRSGKRVQAQAVHLIDKQGVREFEKIAGVCVNKRVILYTGEDTTEVYNGVEIEYKNISNFLISLKEAYPIAKTDKTEW